MFVRESNLKVPNYKCVRKGIIHQEVRIRAEQEIKKVELQYLLLPLTSGNLSQVSGKRRTAFQAM